jgi:hypothetical protein
MLCNNILEVVRRHEGASVLCTVDGKRETIRGPRRVFISISLLNPSYPADQKVRSQNAICYADRLLAEGTMIGLGRRSPITG